MKYRVRVELTESGFADRTATATYGTVLRIPSGIRATVKSNSVGVAREAGSCPVILYRT